MNDEELRAFVRSVVGQRLSAPPGAGPGQRVGDCGAHPSHGRLPVLPGVEAGGPCLIEPRVACNLCGYCQSYGH